MGAQKGPPYRRDLLFWGLTGVLWGARWGLARFLPLLSARFLEFEPQLLAWVGCSISLCLRPVGLFVCLFVHVFVRFTLQW